MLVYFLILLLTLILYINNKYSKRAALLVMLLLFLLTGLRDTSVGIDTSRYVELYLYDRGDENREPLFAFVSDIIGWFNASGNTWLFLISLFIYVPYMIIVKKYSKVPMMSVLLFLTSTSLFFFDGMNGIRQWIACAFILLGLIKRSEGKFLPSLVLFLLALGFHYSSFLYLPILFLPGIKMKKSLAIAIICFFAVLGLGITSTSLSGLFNQYAILMGNYDGMGSDKLANYANYEYLEVAYNWKYYAFTILPISAIAVASFLKRDDNSCSLSSQQDKKIYLLKPNENYLNTVFLIALPILDICAATIPFGHRLAFPLVTVQLLCLPEAYAHNSKQKQQFIELILFYFVLYFIYYIITINGGEGSTVPYKICL